jgi:hypothetical protein
MKKLLSFLLILVSLQSFGQIKISEMQTYLGGGDSVFVPGVVNGVNRKMYGIDLARGKVDSVTVSNDSIYYWKNQGTRYFAGYIAGGGGGGSYSAGYGMLLSGSTFRADTNSVASKAWRQKGIDSVAALLSGYTPTSRTLTINGTAQDLSANRSWSVGTVTSVATGYGLLGGSITGSGTLVADSNSLSTKAWRQKGLDSLGALIATKLSNITGLVTAGTNVTITGNGTSGSPYVINSSGGSGASNDSAYTSLTSVDDTTITFNRSNGQQDTLVISLDNGDKGDIDVISGWTEWEVDTSAITTIKIANEAVTGAKITKGSDFTGTDTLFLKGAWSNVRDFGAVGDGVTNDLDAFRAAAATGKRVYAPAPSVSYFLGGAGDGSVLLQLPDSVELFGDGRNTTITWTANDRAIAVGNYSVIRDIRLEGSGKAGGQQFEAGVLAYNKTNWRIENVIVEEVSGNSTANGGGGIYISALNAATNWQDGGSIINCITTNNGTGFNIDERGEYLNIVGLRSTYNTVGLSMRAGNNTLTNCHIDNNTTGLVMDGGINNGHGVFSNSSFNHNTTGFNISNITLGMVFNGCFFYSDANQIVSSTNIEFNGCHFAPVAVANVITLSGNTNITRSSGYWNASTNLLSGEDMMNITIPSGGTTGQALSKASNSNYDVEWGTGSANSFRELRFIVGTTTNAPVAGDSTFTFTGYINKKVNLFREGELQYDSLTTNGYEFNPGTGSFTFHPPLLLGEKIIIQAYPQVDWTTDMIPAPSSGYETEADTYFAAVATAGGSLTTQQKDDYNDWVVAEKAASRYSKYTAIYPFLGGTSAAHAINAKNPGTYDITWNGSQTHDANGVRCGGTAADYGSTGINASTVLTQNNIHASIYINDDNDAAAYDICYYAGGAINIARFAGTAYTNLNNTGDQTTAVTDLNGMNIITRVLSTEYHFVKAGTVNTKTVTSTGIPNGVITIGIDGGLLTAPSTRRYAFATIGTGLTAAEAQALNTTTTTLQTALGRN